MAHTPEDHPRPVPRDRVVADGDHGEDVAALAASARMASAYSQIERK